MHVATSYEGNGNKLPNIDVCSKEHFLKRYQEWVEHKNAESKMEVDLPILYGVGVYVLSIGMMASKRRDDVGL